VECGEITVPLPASDRLANTPPCGFESHHHADLWRFVVDDSRRHECRTSLTSGQRQNGQAVSWVVQWVTRSASSARSLGECGPTGVFEEVGMFEIEKGMEIPSRKGGGGRPSKYPWLDMEIGDSFFVPAETMPPCGKIIPPGRVQPRRFSQRKVTGGIRVWRVE